MKNFTYSLIAATIGLMSFGTASAQDVTTTSIDAPLAGATVYSNVGTAISYTRENLGPNTITIAQQTDSAITITVLVDGIVAGTVFRNSGTDLPINTPEPIGFATAALPDWSTLGLTTGAVDFCVVTGFNLDTNKTNDTICHSINYESDPLPIDLGVVSNVITAPSSTTFEPGDLIFAYEVEFTNFSTVDLAPGFNFTFEGEIDGDIKPVGLATNVVWVAGETISYEETSLGNIPGVPNTPDTYDFCARTTLVGDPDATNNELCIEITVNEPDPGTWPVGIEETSVAVSNAFFYDGQLTVNMSNTGDLKEAKFVVMNTAGQQVAADVVNFSGQTSSVNYMNLNDVAKGVYILGVYTDGQMIARKKFVVSQ